MSFTTPDLTGFFGADLNLRSTFGNPIVFSIPQPPTWPVGTSVNPDTGEPYSAMAKRTNAAFVTVTITAIVILKEASPLRPQADAQFTEVGLMSGIDIILDVAGADYATVQDASEFQYAGLDYRIEEFKPFELAGTIYRWLCYGKAR